MPQLVHLTPGWTRDPTPERTCCDLPLRPYEKLTIGAKNWLRECGRTVIFQRREGDVYVDVSEHEVCEACRRTVLPWDAFP